MLPANFGRMFFDDPFFSVHQQRMDQMFGQMNQMHGQAPALEDNRQGRENRRHGNEMMPFGMMGNPRDMMSSMMQNMNMMQPLLHMPTMQAGQIDQAGGSGHTYMQSSVFSQTIGPDGKPEVYEAHHSNRTAPGGIREEKKALRDTRRDLEKMAVGRHIKDRGQVVERTRNTRSNEMEQHQEFIGMAEEDGNAFQEEWRSQATQFNEGRSYRPARVKGERRARAIEHRPRQHENGRRRSKY